MNRLLLIGHGYLGREVAARFLTAGWEVLPVSLHGGGGAIACDVAHPAALADLAIEPDWIIHCASTGRGGADDYRRVFVRGCENLLDRFPTARLLFVSSSSVYGQTDGSMVDETSPTEPARETGRLLLEAERLTLSAGGVVARLSGIYGPGRSVILTKFLSGTAVLEGDGSRFLNQIHRDDAARALLHLASPVYGGRVFNVCDSHPVSQAACYRALADRFGLAMPPGVAPDLDRKRGWTHKAVSNAALRATGWNPEYPSFSEAAARIAPTLPGPPPPPPADPEPPK